MALDSFAFRRALGQFATGVTVVSVPHEDDVHGMTANSFTSVSLEPPLVLICVDKRRTTHGLLQRTGRFGVSVLAEDQEDVSNWFAGRRERPASFTWRRDLAPVPILEGCVAWFACQLAHAYDGGDHTIFVGRVERFGAPGGRPLLFHQGRYTALPAAEE